MAGLQPTQVLPSWLSYSPIVTVGSGGLPTTETTIVTLPLTYYGPSIPLGTNGVWTYGGLTSPASTPSRTTTHPPRTSATTTFSTISSIASGRPTSTSSPNLPLPSTTSPTSAISSITSGRPTSTSSPNLPLPSTASLTSSSTPQPTGSALSHPHRLPATSIIAIVIVVAFFVGILSVLAFLYCRRRETRPSFQPIGLNAENLESTISRFTNKYVRRRHVERVSHSEEAGDTDIEAGFTAPPRLVEGTGAASGRITPSSTLTSLLREELLGLVGTHSASSLFVQEQGPEEQQPLMALTPPPRRSTPHSQIISPPLPPPPSINPDRTLSPLRNNIEGSSKSAFPNMAYPESPVSEIDENAALMTATRVRVDSGNGSDGQGINMRLARLGRLSWFDRTPPDEDPQENRASYHSNSSSRRRDMIQRGRPQMVSSSLRRLSVSATTASSGQTVYYDASSRPRSHVSAGHSGPDQWGNRGLDILDVPVPPSAAATFSTIGTRPAHLRQPPGLVYDSSFGSRDVLDEDPPLPNRVWGSVRSSLRSGEDIRGSHVDIKSRFGGPKSVTPSSGGEYSEDVSRRHANPSTTETIVTDSDTGAVMHFPTKVWDSSQGEGEWPEDAWTEFPAPGQAKWWGPPSSLGRYLAYTGDPGLL